MTESDDFEDFELEQFFVAEPQMGGYQRAHRNLEVWKRGIDLVVTVYHKTSNFPKEELYTLVSQMRRSAISIPSNIAEGAARRSRKELLNFLNIASGSASELDTQFVIAQRLGFLPEADPIIEELDHVSAQLGAMMRSLRESD